MPRKTTLYPPVRQACRHFITLLKIERLLEFGSKLLIFGSSQIWTMGLQFIVGLYVVRALPQSDYALYTLANTVAGMLATMGDGGLASSTGALGGRVWTDREKLGAVLAASIKVRKTLARWALAICTPILIAVLLRAGASLTTAFLLTLVVAATFRVTLLFSIFSAAPALHQAIAQSSKISIILAILRTLLVPGLTYLFPHPASPLTGNVIAQAWAVSKAKLLSMRFMDASQAPDLATVSELWRLVKRSLPSLVYFAFSSQISIWLLTFYGNSSSIAEIGALGRLGQLMLVIMSIASALFVPRFARASNSRNSLLPIALLTLCFVCGCSGLITGIVAIFPDQCLLILGAHYSGLQTELYLSLLQSALAVTTGATVSLNAVRGWILHPAIIISTSLLAQCCGLLLFSVSTARSALEYGLFVTACGWVPQLLFLLKNIMDSPPRRTQ